MVTAASMAGAATVWATGLMAATAGSRVPSTDPVPAAVGPGPGDVDPAIWCWLLAGLLALVVGLVLAGRRRKPGGHSVAGDPSGAESGNPA